MENAKYIITMIIERIHPALQVSTKDLVTVHFQMEKKAFTFIHRLEEDTRAFQHSISTW